MPDSSTVDVGDKTRLAGHRTYLIKAWPTCDVFKDERKAGRNARAWTCSHKYAYSFERMASFSLVKFNIYFNISNCLFLHLRF